MTESPGSMIQLSGFPVGYFVIKNAASRNVFDIIQDDVRDGTELILFDEKEKTLVESFRNPENSNQVFFIDSSGALCSRSSGHALDVEGDRVVLRHRRPISFPFPNAHAHPLPKFVYSPETGEISIKFAHDPSYPSMEDTPSTDWEQKTYVLTCGCHHIRIGGPPLPIPEKRKSLLGKLIKSVSPAGLKPKSPVASLPKTPQLHQSQDVPEVADLQPEHEVWVDVEGAYNSEVLVVTVDTATKAVEDEKLTDDARRRRRWLILPLKD